MDEDEQSGERQRVGEEGAADVLQEGARSDGERDQDLVLAEGSSAHLDRELSNVEEPEADTGEQCEGERNPLVVPAHIRQHKCNQDGVVRLEVLDITREAAADFAQVLRCIE